MKAFFINKVAANPFSQDEIVLFIFKTEDEDVAIESFVFIH